MRGDDGGTTDGAETLTDLGSRVEQLRAELAAAREQVRRNDERLEMFAGRVAHDLRNPLTSVSMSLQMLQEQPSVAEDDEALWMVERALAGAEKLDMLIEEQLRAAQLGTAFHPTEVALDRLVAEVAADLALASKGVALEVARLPVVDADRTQLTVVLRTLIANAAAATRPDASARVTVTGERVEAGWRVGVADDGPGRPPEDSPRAFEPSTGSGQEQDAGGLVTCSRIVKAHGGRLGVAASSTGGTLVWFEIPDRA